MFHTMQTADFYSQIADITDRFLKIVFLMDGETFEQASSILAHASGTLHWR